MDNTETSTAQSQKGKEVFLSMVGYLGLKSEVVDKVSGKNIILSVTTDEPGRLIGRNGSALDSLGLLMNRILKKNDVNFPKVIVDVDGYDKKSNRRDKRKSSRDRQERPRRQEKEVAISEEVETSDDSINRYIDDETNTIKPVTTIAVGESDNKNDRRQNRRRGNRRNNDKNTTERNDRRRAPAKDNAEKAKPAVNAPADKAAAPAREKV
ncbi:MAG: hypothetical protein HRT88_16560, partial [Lentisphaeraceae bacterium]|nr:hypothetical protein [Lentisphaeraceae bacterium]